MSRFFVSPDSVGENTIIIDNREDLHHMSKVLRLREGDKVDVSDTIRWEYSCIISSIDKNEAVLQIVDKQNFASEPETRITLFQGVPKGNKFETIVQKCVELGVDSIQPVFMDRTVVVDKGNYTKKVDRLNKIAAETVKQCKRGIIPQVMDPVKVPEMIESFGELDLVLFPYENERGITIKDVLRDEQGAGATHVGVVIGPEGGFSDKEAEAIVKGGGISVSLGKTTLRTETAGMAAVAMILYELEL